jgi:transcriptional regulator with XRE-family HTH domain
MSIRALAKALGISPTRVAQLLRKGMPAEPEAARAWRLQYVPAPTGAKSSIVALHEAVSENDGL